MAWGRAARQLRIYHLPCCPDAQRSCAPLLYSICHCGRFSRVIGCAAGQLHACGHMRQCPWPYLSLSDLSKSCAAVHEAIVCVHVLSACRPWSKVNDETTRAQERNTIQIFRQIDHLEVEIVHILVIITAVTQNHGNCRKSRHIKAKITVITAIVNSWSIYIIP